MSINVGVIGTGNIGQDHIRRITQALCGARVVVVTDIDLARAQRIAKDLGGRAESTGQNLIAAKDVDAVMVTSIGSTHEGYVLAAIEAGKPVRSEAKLSVEILTDWKKRFIASYDVELQEWINSVASGQLSGPSSWDGYAAAVYVLSRGELEDAG